MKNILLIAAFFGLYLYWKKKAAATTAPLYKTIDNSLFVSTIGNTGIAGGLNLGSSSSSTQSAAHAAVVAAKSGVTPVGGTTPGGLATFSGKVSQSKSCFR
jgi:hypothetical protein